MSLKDSGAGIPADARCECECDEREPDECEAGAFGSFDDDWRNECQPGRFGPDISLVM